MTRQRCLESYRQRQISQSDCEITSNCGKKHVSLCEQTHVLKKQNEFTMISAKIPLYHDLLVITSDVNWVT